MMKIWIGPQLFQASSLLASFQVTLVFFPSSRFWSAKTISEFSTLGFFMFFPFFSYFSPQKHQKTMVFLHFSPKKTWLFSIFPQKTMVFLHFSHGFPGLFHCHLPRPGASLSPGRTARPARRGRWPGRRCRFCRTSKRKADENSAGKDWASVNGG